MPEDAVNERLPLSLRGRSVDSTTTDLSAQFGIGQHLVSCSRRDDDDAPLSALQPRSTRRAPAARPRYELWRAFVERLRVQWEMRETLPNLNKIRGLDHTEVKLVDDEYTVR